MNHFFPARNLPRVCATILASAALVTFPALASAQEIPLNVIYVCGGERVYVYGCDIRDTSDNAWCSLGHPDKSKDGMDTYTNTTRGALKKLLPTCTQPSAADVSKRKAADKKFQDIRDADQKRADDAMHAADNPSMPGHAMTPDQRAIARCVTSGRVPATCTGNALMNGLNQLTGNALKSVLKDVPPGPVLAGSFEGAGKWRVEFTDRNATLTCSGLNPDPYAYSLQFKDNRAFVTLNTSPKSLTLLVRGGDLAGAGPVVIDGRVITGYTGGGGSSGGTAGHYETQTVTTHQELTPLEATQYAGQSGLSQNGQTYDMASSSTQSTYVPGTAHYNPGPQPIYGPKRATCAVPALSSKNAGPGATQAATGLLTALFNNGDQGPATPPGIRMTGIFAASTGFSVQFFPESAILGCGPDAARAYPYTVIADGTRTAIKIEAPDHPLLLAMRPDGSLDPGSSESYQVHGRTLLNDHSDDLHFAPNEQTCNLAALSPSTAIPMSGGTARSMNASSPPNGSPNNNGGTLSTPNAPLGSATLSIVSGFPPTAGQPNPLANRPYVLLRTSFNDTIAKSGVNIPAGTTPFKFLGLACGNRTSDCQTIMNAIKTSAISTVRADGNGTGTFPGVPPGIYYLMISTRLNNQPLVWLQQVHVNAGSNSITLDARNAAVMN